MEVEDLGGYHPDPNLSKFSSGSCFANEGKYLYYTVREMKPDVIVEVGRWEGCSTSHLALGCLHNNKGKVYSIDINAGMGSKIPPVLLPWVEFINHDIRTLDQATVAPGKDINLLLEDGAHTQGFTARVLTMFKDRMNGRVIVHDYCHRDCQKYVAGEARSILGDPTEVFFEPPSDCGYGMWKVGQQC